MTKNKHFKKYNIPKFVWYSYSNSLRHTNSLKNAHVQDFPDGTVVKNPPANAGDTGSSPGLGISHTPQSN